MAGGGSLIKGRILSGNMVSSGTKLPHKSERDTCCASGSQKHDEVRGLCPPVSRQPNCCILHQPDGGNSVKAPLHGSHSTLEDSTGQTGMGESCLGSQGAKSVVRHAVQDPAEHVGVLSVPKIGGISVGPLVHTSSGCLREQEMPCAANLLQLIPRPRGTSKRCFFTEKVASKGLLLSPCSTNLDDSN